MADCEENIEKLKTTIEEVNNIYIYIYIYSQTQKKANKIN